MKTGNLLGGQGYPGIYIFTTPTRLMRPVKNIKAGGIEMIGSLEQVYLDVACLNSDINAKTTHIEIAPTNILSVVADLTPFSDFNQSPRNMYQCQMGKQTMGTPYHAWSFNTHNKLYRLQNPQTPVVRTFGQDRYPVDDYPNGANAIVAVISYTGYDMEDAMIINKSSYERGFGHGSVYKTEIIEANENSKKRNATPQYFSNTKDGEVAVNAAIDVDGLPFVGAKLEKDAPFYSIYNPVNDSFKITKYKSMEPAFVDGVNVIGSHTQSKAVVNQYIPEQQDGSGEKGGKIERAMIKLRFDRNPVIGDKFSSRHGQKGVLSQLWPLVDMPFSESGLTPDVIINPHAFPSRMTIGMLVESMAGKAGALHGVFQDATPFRFDEKNTAVDYFGEQLIKAGYNYYGNEPMYSGTMGTEFKADIYLGVVYYQRLRHMVKDKYQVRSTGPVNSITQQPIKGRKVGGGIRIGEMERDSLLAHGISHVVYDRLFVSSDYSMVNSYFTHIINLCKGSHV